MCKCVVGLFTRANRLWATVQIVIPDSEGHPYLLFTLIPMK